MSVFLILTTSSTCFPLIHSVATDDEAMADPHPNVLNLVSVMRPVSGSTWICSFITSPHAGAPTKPCGRKRGAVRRRERVRNQVGTGSRTERGARQRHESGVSLQFQHHPISYQGCQRSADSRSVQLYFRGTICSAAEIRSGGMLLVSAWKNGLYS